MLAARRCYRLFWEFFTAHAQFRRIATSGLKSDDIFEFSARVLIEKGSFRERDTTFGDFRGDNI